MKTKAQDCLFFDHHAVAGLLTGHASPAVGRPPAAKRLEVSFQVSVAPLVVSACSDCAWMTRSQGASCCVFLPSRSLLPTS